MEVSEILDRVDILEYCSQYCQFEERNGEWWCLSPLSSEVTPSFSVNTEKQNFYDFSTGQGGNLLTFIQLYDKCGFLDALARLKRYAGIRDDDNGYIASQRLSCVSVARKYATRKQTKQVCPATKMQIDYMDRYEFDLGKLKIWKDEGITVDSMMKFGVKYDEFSNRIVVPIKDYEGNLINVCGRTLDENFKSKKIPKYIYYRSAKSLNTIFGVYDNYAEIQHHRTIILFEGAKSVMIADGWGIHNTGAILTSHLSELQLMWLIKLGFHVVFALDEDVCITEDKNIQILKHYVAVEYLYDFNKLLDSKMSPVDKGREVFEKLYSERRSLR